MLKKITFITLLLFLVLSTTTVVLADKPPQDEIPGNRYGVVNETGFDEFGYNRNAHIYNGTYGEWCMEKVGDEKSCLANYGDYWNDKLIMKWNEEWDRGNEQKWANGPYGAWLSNHGNGKLPDGSGESYFVKIVWVGPCNDGTNLPEGSSCVWDQFAVIMEKTQKDGEMDFSTHSIPSGYGVNLQKPE